MMTKQFLFTSIVEGVVRRYPEVIEESLKLVTSPATGNGQPTSIFVHHMPGRMCSGRVDVNSYQEMMLACVQNWHSTWYTDAAHKHYGLEVFTVTGADRPMRKLTGAYKSGHMGRCKIEDLQQCRPMPSEFDRVLLLGAKIKQVETNDQRKKRARDEGNDHFYAPQGTDGPTTKRVRTQG